jgi:hypothetical protein
MDCRISSALAIWALTLFKPVLIVTLWGTSIYAAENESNSSETFEIPDLEFIEFLGQWETDEGEWIDPNSLLGSDFAGLLDAAASSSSEDTDNAIINTPQSSTPQGGQP